MKLRNLPVIVIIGLVLVIATGTAAGQSRSLVWERWDVAIDGIDTTANVFTVTESYIVAFTGRFSFGTAVIPLDRVVSIDQIAITQDGRPLAESCTGNEGTFCSGLGSDGLEITYYFTDPVINETVEIDLRYRVTGGLRSYADGDQLAWIAVPTDKFGFEVRESTITVTLPEGAAPREGIDPVVTYGAASDVRVSGTQVTATARDGVSAEEAFEIRIQYPHNPAMPAPFWQAEFDSSIEYEQRVVPLVNLGGIVLALVIAIGGGLGVFALYNARGRDPAIGPVPDYLAEPPSDLRPALVGTLIDEKADPRDVIATLVDLATRGYLVFVDEKITGLFGIQSSDVTFRRTDKDAADLEAWETTFLNALFKGGETRTLASLRDSFYLQIAAAQSRLYVKLVEMGYFRSNPDTTRSAYQGTASTVLTLAFMGFFLVPIIGSDFSTVGTMIAVALGVPGVALMAVSGRMPARTQKGAEEAAKWNAFYRYMANLDRFSAVDEAADRFEKYLPYAVAFGLDKSWVKRFEQVPNVPAPTWYYPVNPLGGGYGGRGYRPTNRQAGPYDTDARPFDPDAGGWPGDVARDAGQGGLAGGLDDLSGGLSSGLDSISSGLSDMLNDAANAMTSRPAASSRSSGSWGGGGRSFSGGGSRGGGGGGGGSRGFG